MLDNRPETEGREKRQSVYYQETQPTWRIGASRGLPIVMVQHPAELLVASDTARFGQGLGRFDEFVLDPLVIASMAIMIDENRDGFAEMPFAEEDQPA